MYIYIGVCQYFVTSQIVLRYSEAYFLSSRIKYFNLS